MNDEINTIKAALEKAKEAACVLGWIGHGYKIVEALKLLETIDPDAIKRECADRYCDEACGGIGCKANRDACPERRIIMDIRP